jgi:hypothetical protein
MENLIIFEAILFRSGHFLQGDMKTAVSGDPIFGIGQILDKSKKLYHQSQILGSL